MGTTIIEAMLRRLKIILVDGGKGGVGKSTVCAMVIDAIRQRGKKILLIDSDPKNPELGQCYSGADYVTDCLYLNLSSQDGFFALIDAAASTTADYIVINSPAGSANWEELGSIITTNLDEINATFQILWVLGRKSYSIRQMIAVRDALPTATIIPVINTYFGSVSDFEIWGKSQTRKSILDTGVQEIIFPATADRITDTMDETNRRWDDETNIPLSHKLECRRFRAACWTALDPIL